MSVTVLPYLTDVSAASSAPASTKQTTGETNTNFKDVLDAATSAQQKMAVDALIAASGSGSVSVSTVQKILGFNPQYTVSSTQTPVATTQETTNTPKTDTASATSSTTETTQTAKTTTSDSDKDSLGCPSELEPYFKEAAEKYNVDINLLKAIAKAESNFNPNAVSSAGALGVMQLMPSTASSLGISNAYNAKANIMGGAQVIAANLKKYNGDVSLALAAYNAGSGNVDKYGGIPPFKETQNYDKKLMNYYKNA